MTAKVRLAGIADEAVLFDQLIAVHRQGMGKHFLYDFIKVKLAIEHGTRLRGGIIGIIDAPDRQKYIAGSVGLAVDEWWWSKDCFMQMRWLYVRPEYRSLGYEVALAEFAEECRAQIDRDPTKKQTAPFVLESSFVDADSHRARLKERLWSRLFGRKIGSVHIKGL